MAIAQRRLPWRLPTKWAWAMEKAGPSRKEAAELWRDPARFPMALSLVLRLPLWRDLARFPVALSLASRLFPARHLRRFSLLTRLRRRPGPGGQLRRCVVWGRGRGRAVAW